jgi:hypothetical protein
MKVESQNPDSTRLIKIEMTAAEARRLLHELDNATWSRFASSPVHTSAFARALWNAL